MVAPRRPDGNGRSCLKGIIETVAGVMEVEGGTTAEGVDRPGGRLEDLRLAACITEDRVDSLMLWATKMEEINSSKEVGSLMSAGTRLFKTSTVRVGLGVGAGVEVKARRMDMDSGSGDIAQYGVVLNLTVGFVYGLGRLRDETFRT